MTRQDTLEVAGAVAVLAIVIVTIHFALKWLLDLIFW